MDYTFSTLNVTKDSDGIGIKILIVVTYNQLLDSNDIVKKIIYQLSNSVHLSMKASKKLSIFTLTSHIQESM